MIRLGALARSSVNCNNIWPEVLPNQVDGADRAAEDALRANLKMVTRAHDEMEVFTTYIRYSTSSVHH